MIRELLVPGYKELKEEVATLRELNQKRCEEICHLTNLLTDLQAACLIIGSYGNEVSRQMAAKAVAESQEFLSVPVHKGYAYPWFRNRDTMDSKQCDNNPVDSRNPE